MMLPVQAAQPLQVPQSAQWWVLLLSLLSLLLPPLQQLRRSLALMLMSVAWH